MVSVEPNLYSLVPKKLEVKKRKVGEGLVLHYARQSKCYTVHMGQLLFFSILSMFLVLKVSLITLYVRNKIEPDKATLSGAYILISKYTAQ